MSPDRPIMTAAEGRWLVGCLIASGLLRWLFGADAWLAVEALAVGAALPWLGRWVLCGGSR